MRRGTAEAGVAEKEPRDVEELIRTNDMVLISYVEALLREAGIAHLVVDQNMSVIEGSLGILPRRVLVDREAFPRAREIIEHAGIGAELPPAVPRPSRGDP